MYLSLIKYQDLPSPIIEIDVDKFEEISILHNDTLKKLTLYKDKNNEDVLSKNDLNELNHI